MAKKVRKFDGLDFIRDNFQYRESNIDYEARKAKKAGFLVRRVKATPYKSGKGNWWTLYTRERR
jgi:hypothetical protein